MDDMNFEPELQEYISAGKRLRVVIADDSKVVRQAIRDRLELGNLDVIEADSGEQALELINQQVPDLVLLDVVMPGLDGISVLKILRNRFTKLQLPVIPVTSRDSSSEIVQALDFGANDYVTKPIDYDVLWARITNQLMQKQAAEYLRHAQKSLESQIKQRTAELNSSNQKLRRVIQERLLAEDRLQRQANYDELTGLPNRSLAKDRLEQTIAKATRHQLNPGVAFIDLDNFKQVNDTLGHGAGDELLKEAATRLSACARNSDTVARLGGDEFLLILEQGDAESSQLRDLDLRHVGERIIRSFSRPFVLDGNEVSVSPSLGFAIFPRDGGSVEELIRNADTAMYRSKNDGKNTYCFYSADMTVKAKMRMYVESRLDQALKRDEFSVLYQPIIDVRSGKIIKAEAMLCWHSRDLGEIAPDYFRKLAEETGLIVPIGEWAIREVCRQVAKWHEAGMLDLSVTVNVSGRQLQSDSMFSTIVRTALEANALPAQSLQLELNEDVLMSKSAAIEKNLEELESTGIGILVDNFGSGHASLNCLQRGQINAVKIERSLIKGIPQNDRDTRLIRAIMATAESLGINVISDGVESKAQVDCLSRMRCRYAQGSYFSQPIPADRLRFYDAVAEAGNNVEKPVELADTSRVGFGA